MPSILKTSTFGVGFTSMLQSVPSWSRTRLLDRQGFFKDREEQSIRCIATSALSLYCWHSCPTFLQLLPFLYPTTHIPCSALVILCLQCVASINTWHSHHSLCTSYGAFLRRKFMEWLSQFPPFLQILPRGGSCVCDKLERTFPWITFNHSGHHLQWDGRLQLDLSFWRT